MSCGSACEASIGNIRLKKREAVQHCCVPHAVCLSCPQQCGDCSEALTGGDITKYRSLVARISYLSQDRPDLKFASMQDSCAVAKPSVRDMEGVKRIGRYFAGKPRAKCWFRWQQSGELEAYSVGDSGGDKTTRRSVSAGFTVRGHCLKVWTKKQQLVSLSTAESELHVPVKTASEGLGIQSVAKDLGIACGPNLHLDASATMLVNRAEDRTRRNTSTCKTCGCRRHPSQTDSSRRKSA